MNHHGYYHLGPTLEALGLASPAARRLLDSYITTDYAQLKDKISDGHKLRALIVRKTGVKYNLAEAKLRNLVMQINKRNLKEELLG